MKDNDNDGRKALRLVYYHVTEVLSSLASVRKVKPGTVTDLFEAVVSPSSGSRHVDDRSLTVAGQPIFVDS